jgi:hypothetical protein
MTLALPPKYFSIVFAFAGDSTTTSIEPTLFPLVLAAPFLATATFFLETALFPEDAFPVFEAGEDVFLAFVAAAAFSLPDLADFPAEVLDFARDDGFFSSELFVLEATLFGVEDLALAMVFLAKRSMHDVPPTRQAGTAFREFQIDERRRTFGCIETGASAQLTYICAFAVLEHIEHSMRRFRDKTGFVGSPFFAFVARKKRRAAILALSVWGRHLVGFIFRTRAPSRIPGQNPIRNVVYGMKGWHALLRQTRNAQRARKTANLATVFPSMPSRNQRTGPCLSLDQHNRIRKQRHALVPSWKMASLWRRTGRKSREKQSPLRNLFKERAILRRVENIDPSPQHRARQPAHR